MFGLASWLLLLSPLLPLTRHLSDYYLTVPLLGCGIILAAAARHFPKPTLLAAALLALLWIPIARSAAEANVQRSRDMEAVVKGVEQIATLHPGKSVLLAGVGDALFWSGIYDRPFSLVGLDKAYLTPDSAATLTPIPELFKSADYTLPDEAVFTALANHHLLVYAVNGRKLVESTALYQSVHGGDGPRGAAAIPIANPLYALFLSKEWYPAEDTYRWMPGAATVSLSGEGAEIEIRGLCAQVQFDQHHQVYVDAEWNGVQIGRQTIQRGTAGFAIRFPLPQRRDKNGTLRLIVHPLTHAPGDTRELSLAITRIAIV